MNETYSLSAIQQKLVEDNLSLVDIILHTRIRPNENIRGMEYDELFQCGCLALCQAAATYDGSVKFATYASCVVYNALIDQCRAALISYRKSFSYDEPLTSDGETHEIFLASAETVDEQIESNELEKLLTDAKNNHHGAVLKASRR